jgi:cobalamin biosynthesis protein CobD/CbiB
MEPKRVWRPVALTVIAGSQADKAELRDQMQANAKHMGVSGIITIVVTTLILFTCALLLMGNHTVHTPTPPRPVAECPSGFPRMADGNC